MAWDLSLLAPVILVDLVDEKWWSVAAFDQQFSKEDLSTLTHQMSPIPSKDGQL